MFDSNQKELTSLDSYAFLDIGPLSRGHALVVPKCALIPLVQRLLILIIHH